MSTPMSVALPTISEEAVTREAEKFIQAAILKHGISRESLPQDAVDDARRVAREGLESNQRNQSNEYFHLYEAQKAELAALRNQLGSVRDNRVAASDMRSVDRMETVRARLGELAWAQLTMNGRLQAQGIDPQSADPQLLRRLFGRDTETGFAVDYEKSNPFKYKQLREAAKTLNITGK
jgi:hypothetical protein